MSRSLFFLALHKFFKVMLNYAKIPYEEITLTHEEWPKMKESGKFLFGQLPALEVNGKMYVQSGAILFYLCRKNGMIPTDPELEYEVISNYNECLDVYEKFVEFFYHTPDAKIKEDKKKEYFTKVVPFAFGKFEEKLKANKNKLIMIGDKMSYVDFGFAGYSRASFLDPALDKEYEPIFKNCPLLKAYLDNLVKIC